MAHADQFPNNTHSLSVLAAQISQAHVAATSAAISALEHGRHCGELLIEAKAQLPHGEWEQWVAAHCTFQLRTAQEYMRVARRWQELEMIGATRSAFREALFRLADYAGVHDGKLYGPWSRDIYGEPRHIDDDSTLNVQQDTDDYVPPDKDDPNVPKETHRCPSCGYE